MERWFDKPWNLLLILPAGAFIALTIKNMVRLARWRRNTIIALRGILLLILILLIAGFSPKQFSDRSTTMFLADFSDSIIKKGEALDFIQKALKGMGRNEEAGIIIFGDESSLEVIPTGKPIFHKIQSRINGSFTNIEKALLGAQSVMPWYQRKRVVLITDGRENAGDSLRQVKQMHSKGYVVDVFPLGAAVEKEVQMQEVKAPEAVNLNQQFELEITVKSSVATKGTLLLYSNRRLMAQKEITLEKGSNRFAFSDKAAEGGTVVYKAEIIAESDTVTQNNSLSSFTFVRDMPKIMIIRRYPEASRQLEEILRKDFMLTSLEPEQLPAEMTELLKYDAFILTNVPAESLDPEFVENLETIVSHQGKGLLVTGGDNSYGPGGYYKTPLEKILPVNMDIKPKEEEPNLALLLVIDKSGSMTSGDYGISRMEMAREAAIRAVELLKEEDLIGVIAFDDALKWVVKPQLMENPKAVQDAIGTIRAGGGTQILPPLQEAYAAIQNMDAKLKHIILLTDGQAEKTGYEPIIDGLREKGITLSTVAVGRGADQLLMKALAYGGQGRYYETDEFSNIPSIFTKEVFLAGKKYLVNRTFSPRLGAYSDIVKGIEAVPLLDGYVATTAKKTADTIFVSDEDEPVLAAWQYGLGRTIAWTPDVQGVWTYDWMNWEEAARFWKNAVTWTVQQNLSKGYSVERKTDGKKGIITLKAEDDDFVTANEVKGDLIGPDGDKQEITLIPSSPGEYRGVFESRGSGTYIADITLTAGEGESQRISAGLVIPYSPEYDLLSGQDDYLLAKIVNAGGGRILEGPEDVFKGELPPVEGRIDMALPLILSLFFLFLADLAFRRLNISKSIFAKLLAPVTATEKSLIIKFAAVGRMQNSGTGEKQGSEMGVGSGHAEKQGTRKGVRSRYGEKQGPWTKKKPGLAMDKAEAGGTKAGEGIGQPVLEKDRQAAKMEQRSTEFFLDELLEKKKKWKR